MNEMWLALIGLVGVIIGAAIKPAGDAILFHFQQRTKDRTDIKRKELLMIMLEDETLTWRKLETLSHVIGADEETTKRLLLEIEARGSEDQQELWGLISRNPFKRKLKN